MDIKHQESFTPSYIKYFDLQAASTLVRETELFVYLYSTTRGQNRWVALARLFELLKQRPEVLERGVKVLAGKALQGFLDPATGAPTAASPTTLRRKRRPRSSSAWSGAGASTS